MVEIRKMENQLRMKTYKVKSNQLIHVFKEDGGHTLPFQSGLMDNVRPDKATDLNLWEDAKLLPRLEDPMGNARPGKAKDLNSREDAKLDQHIPEARNLPIRKSKNKAKLALANQALSRVIMLQKKFIKKKKVVRKEEERWVYLTYHPLPRIEARNHPEQLPNQDAFQHAEAGDQIYDRIEQIRDLFQIPVNIQDDNYSSSDSDEDESDLDERDTDDVEHDSDGDNDDNDDGGSDDDDDGGMNDNDEQEEELADDECGADSSHHDENSESEQVTVRENDLMNDDDSIRAHMPSDGMASSVWAHDLEQTFMTSFTKLLFATRIQEETCATSWTWLAPPSMRSTSTSTPRLSFPPRGSSTCRSS